MKKIRLSALAAALAACVVTLGTQTLVSACEGVSDGIYDPPTEDKGKHTVEGQLYIDASSWTKWHYIDLKAVADSIMKDSTFDASSVFQTYGISTDTLDTADGKSGIYTYWYDVFGQGLSNNRYESFFSTAPQEEPYSWTIAVHRNNVRVNGIGVFETSYTDLASLPTDTTAFSSLTFTPDEWNETDVWVVQSRLLQGLVGNQGITVNKVLSGWLTVALPPVPPSFALNSHVFIIKLHDGTYAALQLKDYQNPSGVKCCLTINYKYPL